MKLTRLLAVAGLFVTTGAWAVDTSLTLTGTSDYRYRGISQTAGDWAAQGSLDLAWDSELVALIAYLQRLGANELVTDVATSGGK